MPRLVTLYDGTRVASDSEEWRAECEARHLLHLNGYYVTDDRGRQLRTSAQRHRHEYLDRVQAKRGRASRDALQAHAMRLWQAGRDH